MPVPLRTTVPVAKTFWSADIGDAGLKAPGVAHGVPGEALWLQVTPPGPGMPQSAGTKEVLWR
jgi:hypothetical protein